MEYRATFEIDGAVSQGFGVKEPDISTRSEMIIADGAEEAYKTAMSLAKNFADDYLSNPKTGLTSVRLLSLKDASGKSLPFDAENSVVERSTLEHLMALRHLMK